MSAQQRALRAKELLDNDTFKEVIADLRHGTMATWRNTAAGAVTMREQAFFEIHALDAIEAKLQAWIDDYDLEAKRQEKSAAKR